MFNNETVPCISFFFFETDSLSFEEKREIKSLHLQTYNVFLITGFLQKRILKKKKKKLNEKDRDAVQVPVVCLESLSLEAPEEIRSARMYEANYSDL